MQGSKIDLDAGFQGVLNARLPAILYLGTRGWLLYTDQFGTSIQEFLRASLAVSLSQSFKSDCPQLLLGGLEGLKLHPSQQRASLNIALAFSNLLKA